MTGRDLIIYILENHLEDVEIETKPLLVPLDKAAVELGCGLAGVKALLSIGKIKGIRLNGKYYIFFNRNRKGKTKCIIN